MVRALRPIEFVHRSNEQSTPFCAVGGRKFGDRRRLAEPGKEAHHEGIEREHAADDGHRIYPH